jgi:hypothetical protein
MTITKVAVLSAKYAVFRAVVSAVSVTQMPRAGLSTGVPLFGFLRANLLVVRALAVGGGEARHLRVGLAAGGLEPVLAPHLGKSLGLAAGVDELVGDAERPAHRYRRHARLQLRSRRTREASS